MHSHGHSLEANAKISKKMASQSKLDALRQLLMHSKYDWKPSSPSSLYFFSELQHIAVEFSNLVVAVVHEVVYG